MFKSLWLLKILSLNRRNEVFSHAIMIKNLMWKNMSRILLAYSVYRINNINLKFQLMTSIYHISSKSCYNNSSRKIKVLLIHLTWRLCWMSFASISSVINDFRQFHDISMLKRKGKWYTDKTSSYHFFFFFSLSI